MIIKKFKEAASAFKALLTPPTEEEYTQCYGLFKQATVGDVNIPDPGMKDRQEKKKWDAWKGKEGMSKDAAKEEYIKRVDILVKKDDDD
ncbi:putative acyl-CoA-binding protein isoform X2 [Megachile rotundata]|uniref:putative acyl-CoA-binding protein isoform X2 n=1 Tax=Megachile rotundata TaxID=143995 RepID=UPI000614D71E|nr:PREDICTED: putative acyl-CoA-binding protein isoform X2 [Megachile rotundata]XP_012153219.1 PREDICTED: putative acyl-CoA-binding protein isoform X2 [Megachile rotundata]